MAVVPMSKVTIYGATRDRKKILETIQKCGILDVSENGDINDFLKIDTSKSRSVFEKNIADIQEGISVLNSYVPEKEGLFSGLEGKKVITDEVYNNGIAVTEKSFEYVKNILRLEKEKNDLMAEIQRRNNQIVSYKPWEKLDVPMLSADTKKTCSFAGVFGGETDLEKVSLLLFEDGITEFDIKIVSKSKEQICVFVTVLKEQRGKIENKLREYGLSQPPFITSMVPKERIDRNKNKINLAQKRILEIEDEIKKYSSVREKLKFLLDYYLMRTEKYLVLEKISQGKNVFVLSGFLPEKKSMEFKKNVENIASAYVETETINETDIPPILLKNNDFSAPTETVLETYSLPAKGEVDPTTVMSIFYYVLFGLMLSDAAYGLLMFLGCLFAINKFKNMDSGMKKSLTMFMYCGISTAFWGVMFGSYFGDAIQVISETFFGKTAVVPAIWFVPVDDPMRMLVFSMAVGVVHIFAGLGMNLYECLKAKDYKSAVFDVVSWYLAVGGAIIYLLSMPMFRDMTGLSFILPKFVGNIGALSFFVGAILIVLFSARASKSVGKRIAKGLYELYGITSYLSDILSYSRLLALGLATGVIASVFNKMGSMLGGGVAGAIFFGVIFIIGHSLNMAINLLGAYVHTNRLQFVEFFGKFYEGGGRKYKPFAINTKYYKFKEEK